MRPHPPFRLPLLLSLLLLLALPAAAADRSKGKRSVADEPEPARLAVTEWLLLGPETLPLPAFHEEKPGAYGIEDLLKEDLRDVRSIRPRAGSDGWRAARAGADGRVALVRPAGAPDKAPAVAFLAARVRTDRFHEVKLEVAGTQPRRAWLDGDPVASGGTKKPENGKEAEPVTGKIGLHTGTHLLVVETVLDPASAGPWNVGAALVAADAKKPLDGVATDLDPARDLSILDVLDFPQITSLAVSPNGDRVAATLTRILPGTDDAETWIELYATADGRVLRTWRGGFEMTHVAWSPKGELLSYVTKDRAASKDGKSFSTLWLADLATGQTRPLLERVENFSGYAWSPTGDAVAFATTIKEEKDKRGMKLHRNLLDRQAGWRDRQVLHLASVPGGERRRLTAGMASVGGPTFSPDGTRLAFLRQIEDVTERPYSKNEAWEIDLRTGAARKLGDLVWAASIAFSPDGRRLLVYGSPSTFGTTGWNVPDGVIPNEYDGELYLWNPETGETEAITRTFDPAVTGAVWSRHDGNVYFRANDRDAVRLSRYDVSAKRIAPLEIGADVLNDWAFAESAAVAAVTGTSPWEPETLRVVDLASGVSRLLSVPYGDWFEDVKKGEVAPFVFTSSAGREVDGRVYFPPGYDAAKRAHYPAIVYYYGGTNPIERDYGGRYPKEWWAAQGYVVYVPQPTGATGYGQASSAVHVNDWGAVTTEEILEGTRAFLAAYPAVDAKRVGCIGASYGGFETMLLTTKTDLYAAAVAHAGISQLGSYWGEGYWGYAYSAGATAGSFPWNRPDIYVERSPLYRADKAKTPILMTHGASDTNVPVGESVQYFTALRLLGVPSELLEIEGQDHLILDHAKRIVWSRSIVAWFDRWLKGRPEAWEALHPKP